LHRVLPIPGRLRFFCAGFSVQASHAVEQLISSWPQDQLIAAEAELREYLHRVIPGRPDFASMTMFLTSFPWRVDLLFDHRSAKVELQTLVKLR
jgi:hypothetical protein